MLKFPLESESIPVIEREDGSIRIEGTSVLLYIVVEKYNDGCSAKDIVESFSTLDLARVHRALAWYLENKKELDARFYKEDMEAEARYQEHISRPENKAFRVEMIRRKEEYLKKYGSPLNRKL